MEDVPALVIAGCDGPELLKLVDRAFHDVALLVPFGVEARRSPCGGAPFEAGALRVGFLRDRVLDSAPTQVATAWAVAVGLVGRDALRPGTWSAGPEPRYADRIEDGRELGAVGALPRGDDQRERAAPSVRAQMNFGGEPAAGAAESFTAWTTSARRATRQAQAASLWCPASAAPFEGAKAGGGA